MVRLRQFLGRELRLGKARGPSAAALFIKKYNDFRYVGLGLVKPISEPSAAARTG